MKLLHHCRQYYCNQDLASVWCRGRFSCQWRRREGRSNSQLL